MVRTYIQNFNCLFSSEEKEEKNGSKKREQKKFFLVKFEKGKKKDSSMET